MQEVSVDHVDWKLMIIIESSEYPNGYEITAWASTQAAFGDGVGVREVSGPHPGVTNMFPSFFGGIETRWVYG